MGLGIFRWRILLLVAAVLLIWQSSRVWYIFTEGQSSIEAQLQENQMITSINQEVNQLKQKIHIAVYYEALCPDSRSFFIKQLLPTYQRIPENIQVELVPYGKATTVMTDHGYEFVCQHGPTECQANIIHACSIEIIKNPTVQLEYLSCMIKNNMSPESIMEGCAEKMNLDSRPISKCYTGERGKELLANYGYKTNALRPRVSFIPTVTLDGNSQNQARILKNLLHEVCLLLKVIPESCMS